MDVRKIAILAILMSLLVGCVPAQDVATPETPTVTEETVTPTTEETETPGLSDSADIWLLFLVLFVIGILIVFPWLVTTYANIHVRNAILTEIHYLQDEELKKHYYKELLTPIPERKGLSRFSMMLAVTLIIGTVVLYLVIKEPGSELLKTVVGVLTGALASIIGFFFGGRTAESASEGAHPSESSKKPADKPVGNADKSAVTTTGDTGLPG